MINDRVRQALEPLTHDSLSPHPHGFFTRLGGVSTGIYESLNTGRGSDDAAAAIAENRRRVCAYLSARVLVTPRQVHSAKAVYIKDAEDSQLVELYNTISDNEAVYNEESSSILIKTPETSEIIADAEKAEAPEEEVVVEKEKDEDKEEDKEELKKQQQDQRHNQESVEEEDMGEEVELEVEAPAEDKFTNDLDPEEKK